MGYGRKTDYATGRVLDLDATYNHIIKPVVKELGINCVRADEIKHSGIIDVPMYQHLLTADIVIADISTCNPNALYELGVRHALRPRSTVIMAESELPYPFDINHSVIHSYVHLGVDIGFGEVQRMHEQLRQLLAAIMSEAQDDSPVYHYLAGLVPPLQQSSIDAPVTVTAVQVETLGHLVKEGEAALALDGFSKAKALFEAALTLDPHNVYVRQRLALCTYKNPTSETKASLDEAWGVLSRLQPDRTTDPETLGLAGAIKKRLWETTGDKANLDRSIFYYEKGFLIQNDYYNGINLAFLFDVRSQFSSGPEAIADAVLARRVRTRVADICDAIIKEDYDGRNDQYWLWSTLAEAHYGLGHLEKYEAAIAKALALNPAHWMKLTTESQIDKLGGLLRQSPLGHTAAT